MSTKDLSFRDRLASLLYVLCSYALIEPSFVVYSLASVALCIPKQIASSLEGEFRGKKTFVTSSINFSRNSADSILS